MKNILILGLVFVLFISLASAEIILTQGPNELYNFGDVVSTKITIKTTTEVAGSFDMYLLCNGKEVNFFKNGIGLSAGEEVKLNPTLVLNKVLIGEIKGICKMKAQFGEEYIMTEDFKISDSLNVNLDLEETSFDPGQSILVMGGAVKENGKDVNGFLELSLVSGNSSGEIKLETISNGFFEANLSFPSDMKAGEYVLKLSAYEKDSLGQITNHGIASSTIFINQVPTNLEIFLENEKVIPGENLRFKTILHDQTGESIVANSVVTIKNKDDKILEQVEIACDEFLEYPILYNEAPEEWTVVAVADSLSNELIFEIEEKKDVEIEIINKTLIITNKGNVLYNDSVVVKIGNESLNLNVVLDVNGIEKYLLTAPDGEYEIKVMVEGKDTLEHTAMLTGKVVSAKVTSEGIIKVITHPFVWIFIIIIFALVAFIFFKKGYRKSFIGYIKSRRKPKDFTTMNLSKSKNVSSSIKNKAELSLSIKGDKQSVSVVCLRIKNYKDLENKKENLGDILNEIIGLAESKKAVVYDNEENLFFILSPLKTKTFQNERNAIGLAKEISIKLGEHNKLAKQKIDFGISLNYGNIVAKQEEGIFKFMSMGTLITTAKKIASLSEGEVLLSEKMNEKVKVDVKTEKHIKSNLDVYTIKAIKDREANDKFISNFLNRIQK